MEKEKKKKRHFSEYVCFHAFFVISLIFASKKDMYKMQACSKLCFSRGQWNMMRGSCRLSLAAHPNRLHPRVPFLVVLLKALIMLCHVRNAVFKKPDKSLNILMFELDRMVIQRSRCRSTSTSLPRRREGAARKRRRGPLGSQFKLQVHWKPGNLDF